MNKIIILLCFLSLFFLTSCDNDDDSSFSSTPNARIDKIIFTNIPVFTNTKPSEYNYFSIVTDFNSSRNYSNEVISLKDELIYDETIGLVNNLIFTYDDYIIPSNSSRLLQTNILFGASSTDYVNDLDNLVNINLADIYEFDSAETFEKSYTIEITSSNTILDNSEGNYELTIHGTFIYD